MDSEYQRKKEKIKQDVDMAIEFGNGVTLKGLNRRIVKEMTTMNISDMDSLAKVAEEISN